MKTIQGKAEAISSYDKLFLVFAYASLGVMLSGVAVISKGYEYLSPEFYEIALKSIPNNIAIPFFFSIAGVFFYKETGIKWLTLIIFAISVLWGWNLYGLCTVAVIGPIGLMKATFNLPLFLLGALIGLGVIYSYFNKFSRKANNA